MAWSDCQFKKKNRAGFDKYKTELGEGMRKSRLDEEYDKSKILYLSNYSFVLYYFYW